MLNPSRKALNAADVPFILLSGGIDSTALLSHLVLEEELRPRGIFLDVGQRSAARQLAAVKKLSLRYNIAVDTPVINLVDLFLPIIGPPHPMLTETALPDVLKPDEPVASATLLTIGSFYAGLSGAGVLYYPATSEDQNVVPKLEEISELVARIVRLNTGIAEFSISMPYLGKSHSEALDVLMQNDADAETWSCNWGGPFHCGSCIGCHIRKNRFSKTNRQDVTRYSMDYCA
jgi:7-cyano-7-deazaguanine synthase in queuosine biosynthesis